MGKRHIKIPFILHVHTATFPSTVHPGSVLPQMCSDGP